MPFRMEGWVEVDRSPDAGADSHAWQGILRIGPLVDAADETSEQLFGLSKAHASPPVPESLVGGRGVPADPSPELSADLGRIAEFEAQYGKGEFGGYTHATWKEIATSRATAAELRSDDWGLVLNLMERLAKDPRLSGEGIRIVVWYNW